jgi:hypothetical protein
MAGLKQTIEQQWETYLKSGLFFDPFTGTYFHAPKVLKNPPERHLHNMNGALRR